MTTLPLPVYRFAVGLRTLGLAAGGLLLLVAGTGCGSNATSLAVPMTWRPTSTINTGAFAGSLPDSAIYVAPATDKRPQKDQVGENAEDDAPSRSTRAASRASSWSTR